MTTASRIRGSATLAAVVCRPGRKGLDAGESDSLSKSPMVGAPQLPAGMLAAAAALGDARISVIVGAGCSKELPTDQPLSPELSRSIHRRLVSDGVLNADDCADPGDLSLLADAVFAKRGSQRELVDRMDLNGLKNARSNEGYRIVVALMLEGVVRTVVTLNFDLALYHALSEVGTGGRISCLKGPEDWSRATDRTVVYLHRNVESDAERLVLRSQQLDDGWKDSWNQIVALSTVGAPVCVFAGLGTPMAVWVESTRLVRDAVSPRDIYLVGPDPREQSAFAGSLGVDETHYVRLGWCEFMKALARRTLDEHAKKLLDAVAEIDRESGGTSEGIAATSSRLFDAGIVRTGQARSAWLMQKSGYLPLGDQIANLLVADLVKGISEIERATNSAHRLGADGIVEFRAGDRFVGRAVLATGAGVRTAEALKAKVLAFLRSAPTGDPLPSLVILAGASTGLGDPAPPENIVDQDLEDSVVFGPNPVFVTLAQIRADPGAALSPWSRS